MIGRAGYDLLRVALRVAVQLWPLWLFWWVWDFASDFYRDTVLIGSAHIQGLTLGQMNWSQYLLWRAWPVAALCGPALLMFVGIIVYRTRLLGRLMGIGGIAGMAIATVITIRPEALRLSNLLGQGYVLNDVLHNADASIVLAGAFGILMVVGGIASLTRPFPVAAAASPCSSVPALTISAMPPGCPCATRSACSPVRTRPMAASSSVRPTGSTRTASPGPPSIRPHAPPGAAAAPPRCW